MRFMLLITYSFDTDYVSIPCETEEEALELMEQYLKEEKRIVETESEYVPTIVDLDTYEKVFSYTDSEFFAIGPDNYFEHDYALYKIIEIGHNDCREKTDKPEKSDAAKKNELFVRGYAYFPTNAKTAEEAYEEFIKVCDAGGINADNMTKNITLLNRADKEELDAYLF